MPEAGTVLTQPATGSHANGPRVVARRRALPGGRAVIGGILVAGSAVGLFAAYGEARGTLASRYVTVSHDVRAGDVLAPGDLVLVPIDLPAKQRAVSFTDPARLVGTVVLARMRAGELVQSADVAEVENAGDRAQISLAVEPANAMNGDRAFLRGGERVDVIVTFDRGGNPITRTVARDVLVVDVLAADRSLGTSGQLTVVLSVERDELEPIAGAATGGTVTLARTTGLRR
jgi:Flp pilus assembly protein CpaB